MSQVAETGTISLGGPDSPSTILVKFFFTNSGAVPDEIPEKRDRRFTNPVMDQLHTDIAKALGLDEELGKVGRVREGRVDTGKNIINNLSMVQVADLLRQFASADYCGPLADYYYLTNVHWFEQPARAPGKKPKFIVVLGYNQLGPEKVTPAMLELAKVTENARMELSAITWQFCHVWQNLNGVTTVNMVGRQPGANPKHAIVVRDGELRAIAL